MRVRQNDPWGLWLAALAGFTLLPLCGPAATLASAILLPLAGSCMLASRSPIWFPALLTAGTICGALQLLPMPLCAAVLVLCVGLLGFIGARHIDAYPRGVYWMVVYSAAIGTALALSVFASETPLRDQLADAAADWVERSPRCQDLLFSAYQFGLARLPAGMEKFALIQVGAATIMPNAVRAELLGSLRTSLWLLVDPLIPRLTVNLSMLMAVLCAALPDKLASRRAGWSDLPRFSDWALTKEQGIAAGLLGVGFLFELGGASGSALFFCRLCWTAFCFIFGVQGIAVMWERGERYHRSLVGQVVWILLVELLFSALPIVYGVMDQLLDTRRLRPHPEDDEDDDGDE